MSRKSRFEDDNRRQTVDGDDSTKERGRRNASTHRASQPESKPHNAVTNETVGAAFTPLGDATTNSGQPIVDIGVLQHTSARAIREFAPDETPDRNVGVSATRFFMELEATTQEQMTAEPKSKKNKQSKLKTEDSRFKFEQGEKASDNNDAQSPSDTDKINNDTGNEIDNDNANPNKTDTADDLSDSDTSENTTDIKPKPKQPKPNVETSDEAGDEGTSAPSSEKTNSRLQFSKDEKAVSKLEKQSEKLREKLDKAQDKLPTKKVKKKQLVFDEDKGKTVTKLTHEKEKIPIGEAKWNNPKAKTLPAKAGGAVASLAVTKIHAKVQQSEHDNVGVKAAHKAELMAESGYRGTKRTVNKAYRFHKNSPYRHVAKLEQKSIKNNMKLEYHKALRDNPKLKSNPLSRFMQKRAIKRNYAKDLRASKNAAKTSKKAVGITAKVGRTATNIIRKNPVFIVKAILFALIIFLILSMLTMCVGMFSGTSSFVGAVSYAAEIEDIDSASILYTELETDLQVRINDIDTNYPGYDEYRISAGTISHNPFELMAFLTAVYQDFTFSEVEAVIRAIFDEQYNLSIVPEVEIRTRTETRSDTYTDPDTGETYTDTYEVEVEYEWHILNVTLTAEPMSAVLNTRMNTDQRQQYEILMMSNGARQLIGSPFDFDWLPNVTSLYGYRIHPISGVKQFHWGLDVGLPEGTPLLAGLDGVIVAVGYDADGYGNYVVIESENGNQVRYAHCHEVFVSVGDSVAIGEVIATVGNTGASTGAHLHIEVSIGGQRVNPIFFLVTGNEGKSHIPPGQAGGVIIPEYPGAPMDDARFAAIMNEAMNHLGKPYVWGASGPNSFDCSGFVSYVLNQSGVASFGRTNAQGLFNLTTPISRDNLQPGDLVFLTGTYSTTSPVTHVGIYIGNGMVVHAGNPVSYANINSSFWTNHYYASGRLP